MSMNESPFNGNFDYPLGLVMTPWGYFKHENCRNLNITSEIFSFHENISTFIDFIDFHRLFIDF